MKETYLCLAPDQDGYDDFEDAHEIESYDAEGAANDFCEQRFGDWEHPRGPIHVLVRCPDGVVVEVEVTVDYEPTFHCCEVELGPKHCEHRHKRRDGFCPECHNVYPPTDAVSK